ncbi:hypothetical protein JK358_17325 [Nocardia sp. 2]|uniref:Ig-like domain-containing protein n=1 Tax=Nocardia acididurans TaxID=2802282 RepID=A0ABS1M691_9NOCA|nr:hypothetical protein [Nocardia acididurans]MBL1076162.1 hypothetical protein [Nocardia acididurans]
MRGPVRAALIAAAALMSTLPGAGASHATPENPPPVCTVPTDLAERRLILYGSTPGVPSAPNGDSLVLVRFPSADRLQYIVVGTGSWQDSDYTYSSPEPGTAVLTGRQTTAGNPVDYTLTLTCRTNDTGDYRYEASSAPAAGSEHTAVYRFTQPH